jgi:uncharacterized protein YndB with AHSA1/START domain/DNA-binding transcriptional ArsR family regulator
LTVDAGFAALSHPLRRTMLDRLAREPLSISELAEGAAMTFAAVSKHLRVLEGAGLVVRRVAGREHRFAAIPGGLDQTADWIAEHSKVWQQSLDRLKQLMEDEVNAPLVASGEVLIDAPPDRVFAAWCDQRAARKFLCVGDPAMGEARIDARVGGEIFVVMADAATRILHRGEFLVVDPPRRLMFTWLSQPTGLRLTVVTVDFEAEGRRTRVKLRHEGFAEAATAQAHSGGWSGILEALKVALDER